MVSDIVFASLWPTAEAQPILPLIFTIKWIQTLFASAVIDLWGGMIGVQGYKFEERMLAFESDISPAPQNPEGPAAVYSLFYEILMLEDVMGKSKVWPSVDQAPIPVS